MLISTLIQPLSQSRVETFLKSKTNHILRTVLQIVFPAVCQDAAHDSAQKAAVLFLAAA